MTTAEATVTYACTDCGKASIREVWHCAGCQRHWPMGRGTCYHCGAVRPEIVTAQQDQPIEGVRVMKVRISEIRVGERRREDLGDLTGLIDSIGHHGLMNPVIIDSEKWLVAGERRLRSCLQLGWEEIEVRDFGELTAEERREIELEENTRRKQLTTYEEAKQMTVDAAQAAAELREEAEEHGFCSKSNKNPAGGRPPKPDAAERIAERLKVDRSELVRAEQQVRTADAYPFMQNPEWKQSHVLQARGVLEKIPEHEREFAADMVSEAGVPPLLGVQMLQRISGAPEDQRQEVYRLYLSDDSRDKDQAMTWAAEREPPPDPRILIYKECIRELRRSNKLFPDDPEVEVVVQCISLLEQATEEVQRHGKERASVTAHA